MSPEATEMFSVVAKRFCSDVKQIWVQIPPPPLTQVTLSLYLSEPPIS